MERSFFNSMGKRVRILREGRGLKQVELAHELSNYGIKIGSPQISKIEADTAMPSVEVLVGLARALETSADYLLMLTDDPASSAQQDTITYISPEADEIAHIVDSLSADARRDVLAVVQRITQAVNGPSPRKSDVDMLLRLVELDYGIDARRRLERALLGPFDRLPGTGD